MGLFSKTPNDLQTIRADELRDGDYVYDFGPDGSGGALPGDAGIATIVARYSDQIEVRSSQFSRNSDVWTMQPPDKVQIRIRD